jgi:hypothetical protein
MFTTTKRQNQIAGQQTMTARALRIAWQTSQPLGFAAGQSNLYQYVGDDPTDLTDPSGEKRLFPPDDPNEQVRIFPTAGTIQVGAFSAEIDSNHPFGLAFTPQGWSYETNFNKVSVISNVRTDLGVPGIVIGYYGFDAKSVKFLQFKKFDVSYKKGGDTKVFTGSFTTEHGKHEIGGGWEIDRPDRKDKDPTYVKEGANGGYVAPKGNTPGYASMIDMPLSPVFALQGAYKELNAENDKSVTAIEARGIFTTYILRYGTPVAILYWTSSVTWHRGDSVDTKSLTKKLQVRLNMYGDPLFNDPDHIVKPGTIQEQWDVLQKSNYDKTVWTKNPAEK